MKSLKNYVVLVIALIVAILFILSNGVQASPNIIFGTGNTAATPTLTTTTTPSANLAAPVGNGTTSQLPTLNTTPTAVPTTTITPTKDPTPANTVKVNTTNTTNSTGSNLPQTGENDTYIVSAIGAVALVVGGIAYAKSRKYNM